MLCYSCAAANYANYCCAAAVLCCAAAVLCCAAAMLCCAVLLLGPTCARSAWSALVQLTWLMQNWLSGPTTAWKAALGPVGWLTRPGSPSCGCDWADKAVCGCGCDWADIAVRLLLG